MICLMFPSASHLTGIGQLQARAKLSAFEYENKQSRENNNRIKVVRKLKMLAVGRLRHSFST